MGRSQVTAQARLLRALADRIEDAGAPLPPAVFEPLEALAPHESTEELGDDVEADLSPEEWERAWGDEIKRRMEDLRAGKTKTVPAAQALSEIRAELDRRHGR